MRYGSSQVMSGAAEVIAYGTVGIGRNIFRGQRPDILIAPQAAAGGAHGKADDHDCEHVHHLRSFGENGVTAKATPLQRNKFMV